DLITFKKQQLTKMLKKPKLLLLHKLPMRKRKKQSVLPTMSKNNRLLQPKPKHKLTKLKPLLTKLMPFKKRFLKKKQPKQKCRLN
ncbi:hypothetical protein BABA_02502, partial [Neobacillus bataviensis LMG 21833]